MHMAQLAEGEDVAFLEFGRRRLQRPLPPIVVLAGNASDIPKWQLQVCRA